MTEEKQAPASVNWPGAGAVTNGTADDISSAAAVKRAVDPITTIESLLLQSTRLENEAQLRAYSPSRRSHTEHNQDTEAKLKTQGDEQSAASLPKGTHR